MFLVSFPCYQWLLSTRVSKKKAALVNMAVQSCSRNIKAVVAHISGEASWEQTQGRSSATHNKDSCGLRKLSGFIKNLKKILCIRLRLCWAQLVSAMIRESGWGWGMGEGLMINSWHSEADPSRQCCCGIAGVRACPAPGWCPEGSWQMVLTPGRESS